MTAKTTFANGVSPFGTPPEVFDAGALPPKNVKAGAGGTKYDYIFDRMERGQGIKCTPADVNLVASALQHWLKTHDKPGKAVQEKRHVAAAHTTKPSRVWWV